MTAVEDIAHIESLVLISGLSGAGKSTASRAFSDEGFYAIDNLPIALLPNFLALSRNAVERFRKTSVMLDIVSEKQVEQLFRFLSDLPENSSSWQIVFLDAAQNSIIKRYSETRRPHPAFDPEKDKTIADAIQRERGLLQRVKERANVIIDSTKLSPHDLRREVIKTAASFQSSENRPLRVNFQSFGFKYGAPTDCDLLIDVRFLPNPYFVDELRPKTGLDSEVSEYVLKTNEAQEFLQKYSELLQFLLPHYAHEGKAYLNIGIGCTGGKHRSVTIAHELARLTEPQSYLVSVSDRDREK